MFCPNCGAQLPANAKFCTGCGQPVGGAAAAPAAAASPPAAAVPVAPADEFAGITAGITVRLQGADAALRANGSYDEVSLGTVTPPRFLEILQQLLPQTPPAGDDVSPINVIARGPGGESSFMIDGGRITGASGGREYTPQDAVRKMLGQPTQAKVILPKGWRPVRHPELPPTDRDEADPTKVSTSGQPQASVRIWVGDFAQYLYYMSWVGLGMTALVLLGSFGPFQPKPFIGALVAGGLLFWGNRAARRSGYQEMRMGADWGTNTLWVHVDGRTHLTPDASCVQDFQLVERTRTTTRGSGLKKQTSNKTVYLLVVLMSSGQTESVRGLPEFGKRKAHEVLGAARTLLSRL
jgi:hypothetical protein